MASLSASFKQKCSTRLNQKVGFRPNDVQLKTLVEKKRGRGTPRDSVRESSECKAPDGSMPRLWPIGGEERMRGKGDERGRGRRWRGGRRREITANVTRSCWRTCCYSRSQVSNTRSGGRIRPATSSYVAPGEKKNPILLFWRFQIKWGYVIILETCSHGQYFYTQINYHQMQRQLFNYIFGSSLSSLSYTGPLRGGHDAEVAHGESEFDTPVLGVLIILVRVTDVVTPEDPVVVLRGTSGAYLGKLRCFENSPKK